MAEKGQIRVDVNFNPQSIADLKNLFDDLPNNVRVNITKRVFKTAATVVLKAAEDKVPKKTGALYFSLGVVAINENDGFGARVLARRAKGYRGNHGYLIEFGHRIVIRRKVGFVTGLYDIGFQPPQPFMRPALEENKDKVLADIAAGLKEAVGKYRAKQARIGGAT